MQNFPHIFAFKFAFIFSKTLQILLFLLDNIISCLTRKEFFMSTHLSLTDRTVIERLIAMHYSFPILLENYVVHLLPLPEKYSNVEPLLPNLELVATTVLNTLIAYISIFVLLKPNIPAFKIANSALNITALLFVSFIFPSTVLG